MKKKFFANYCSYDYLLHNYIDNSNIDEVLLFQRLLGLLASYCICNNEINNFDEYAKKYLKNINSIMEKLELNGYFDFLYTDSDADKKLISFANNILKEIINKKEKTIIK